jgi:hypothetical protein
LRRVFQKAATFFLSPLAKNDLSAALPQRSNHMTEE